MTSPKKPFHILGISGSINPGSTAARLLQAIARLAAQLAGLEFQFTVFEGIGDIPHFNPQQASSTTSEAVLTFRKLWKEADAAIICTPEYAYGMPGTLKNALDWLVSSGEIYHKPVSALSYSPSHIGGEHALSTLQLTLTAQNVAMTDVSSFPIPFIRQKLTLEGEIVDEELIGKFRTVLATLSEKNPDVVT